MPLVAEFEVVEDVPHVGQAVQAGLEVGLELLPVRAGP